MTRIASSGKINSKNIKHNSYDSDRDYHNPILVPEPHLQGIAQR